MTALNKEKKRKEDKDILLVLPKRDSSTYLTGKYIGAFVPVEVSDSLRLTALVEGETLQGVIQRRLQEGSSIETSINQMVEVLCKTWEGMQGRVRVGVFEECIRYRLGRKGISKGAIEQIVCKVREHCEKKKKKKSNS